MNNNIKCRTSKEVKIQLKRAEFQKKILIKNIYKEYEIYYQIVRKSILSSTKKGLIGLYSDLSHNNKKLNAKELTNFFNKKISLLIHSKLAFITIEQLKLEDFGHNSKHLINVNALKELVEFKKYETINFDFENDLTSKEALEFHCNDYTNTYEYYEPISEGNLSSVNLDARNNSNDFYKENSTKKNSYINDIDSFLDLVEEINDIKLIENDNIEDKLNDDFISSDDLNLFEKIDKSFNYLLLKLSYKINFELFKIKLIHKFISEDTFKTLLSSNYLIKHILPFVISLNLNQNKCSDNSNKFSDIFLFNISSIELEFDNLELSICRNKINQLKNRFILLNKKYRFWKNKELCLSN